MKDSQTEILNFLEENAFDLAEVEELIKSNPKSKKLRKNEVCPRCLSDKTREDNVELYDTGRIGGGAHALASEINSNEPNLETNEVKCNVCGYWISDPNNEQPILLKFFRNIFKRNN